MHTMNHVLIVEDLADIAQWLHAQLDAQLSPRYITHAENLTQANASLRQHAYDLALVDLGLPDGNGTDFIRDFKAHNPQALCIVVTIYDDADHLLDALRAGADGYLLKDDTEAQFAAQLIGILDGQPPLSASIARYLLQHFRPSSNEQDMVLTQREADMLTLTAQGLSTKSAARQLGISYHTARGYLKEVYRKLHVSSRAEATCKAINMKLISPNQ